MWTKIANSFPISSRCCTIRSLRKSDRISTSCRFSLRNSGLAGVVLCKVDKVSLAFLGLRRSGSCSPCDTIVEASNVSRLGAFLKEDLGNEIRRLANNRLALNPSPSNTVTQVNSVLPGFTGTIPDLPSSSTTTFTTPERRLPSSYLPVNTSPTKVRAQASDQSLAASLPVMAKYLLVASFFASFNSVKSDVVHFVKIDEGIAKKGKRGRKAVAKKPGTGLKVSRFAQDYAQRTHWSAERDRPS